MSDGERTPLENSRGEIAWPSTKSSRRTVLGNDHFNYLSVAENGPTKATRDTIDDFEPGNDVIDLSKIDANTKVANDQAFSFLGLNAGFGAGIPGGLRYVHEAGDTIVQADVNGDAVVDFSIKLTGIHTLSSDDFDL